jgi:pimeloyl-ACP methyl ester carboxylesterase
MTPISRVLAGSLIFGHIGALALVLGPLGGAEEHVITGAVLVALATSWALVAALSILWANQPQQWAAAPAIFMGVMGMGLLVFAPGGETLNVLGWVWPSLWLLTCAWTVVRVRSQLHGRIRPWLVYPLLGVYALAGLGGGYQTVRDSFARRMPASGQLVDVGGHRLHVQCSGAGAPAVVLESGLGETAAYWGWITAGIARETTVCVYDRAGRGWSDPAGHAQDGAEVARDLHALLDRAGIPGPYVLVGHSSGAQYVRIFADRYRAQVAGMVLLDGQPAEAFEGLPNFPAFYNSFRRVSGVLPSLARVGIGRLAFHGSFHNLTAADRDGERLDYSSARHYRSLRDEFAELPASLEQARRFQTLGNRPLVVVTAARDAQDGWLPLQDRMAALSTNSSHRVLPYSHDSLVTDQDAARASSQAVRDVVRAVRSSSAVAVGGV